MAQTTSKDASLIPEAPKAETMLSGIQIGRNLQGSWIWKNLSFDLFPGDRLAITGPSGTGKSLLLRALAGLDPIQAGQITFQGRSLSDLNLPKFRAQVVYLHQQPALLEGTVESNLKQVYKLATHRNRQYDRDQIRTYLSLLNRPTDFLSRATEHLSGGERQILACLRALQLSPQVLLLDEPSASLDNTTTEQLEALIHQWQQEGPPRAVIWTSHDPVQLARVTTRRLTLALESV